MVRKKLKKSSVFRIFILFCAMSVMFSLVSQHMQIDKKRQRLQKIQTELTDQKSKNQKINEIITALQEKDQEYIENIAKKDLDLVNPGERVFINISGD